MSDRPRNPSRAGLFSGETQSDRSTGEIADPLRGHTFGPHHPVSPPAIESPTESPVAKHGGAEQLAQTLKDILWSLPGRSDAFSTSPPASVSEEIAGVATPAFDDRPTDERRAKLGEDDLDPGTDSVPTGPGRGGSPAVGRAGVDSSARPDRWSADRGEGLATVALAAPISAAPDGEPAGQTASNSDRVDEGGTPGGQAAERPYSFAVETAMVGVAAGAIVSGVASPANLGGWSLPSDRATIEAVTRDRAPVAGVSPENVAVGPIGPVGRIDEGFDRASSPPAPATTWDGVSGGDPFASGYGNASPGGEGPGGVDMGPTNALLGQILDELRRHQQSPPIASGRSVYPER